MLQFLKFGDEAICICAVSFAVLVAKAYQVVPT